VKMCSKLFKIRTGRPKHTRSTTFNLN